MGEWWKLKFFEVDLQVLASTIASVVVAGGLFGWIRSLPHNRIMQMIAVGSFVGPIATIIAMRYWHLDDFWCLVIGGVAALLGQPLLVRIGVTGPSIVDGGVDGLVARLKAFISGSNPPPPPPPTGGNP